MDRKSFLCCQPFLFPLCLSSVPDDSSTASPNDSNSDPQKSDKVILLGGMSLSIEPCENTSYYESLGSNNSVKKANVTTKKENKQSIGTGPAYFLTKNTVAKSPCEDNSFQRPGLTSDCEEKECTENENADHALADPSVCNIEIILHTNKVPPKGMSTPVKKRDRRDLSEIEGQVGGKDEAILIANIDDSYFQIDLNRILSISTGQSELKHSSRCKDTTNEKSNSNLKTEMISFLIIEFPSCCFRIFPSEFVANAKNEFEDPSKKMDVFKSKFDDVRDRLERLRSCDSLLPFPLSYFGLASESDQIFVPDIIYRGSRDDTNDDPLVHTRRCLKSYEKSWEDIIMFDETLETPNPETPIGKSRDRKFKETINDLMISIPQQVSSSFIEQDKLTRALEICENKIASNIAAFDDIINNFLNDASEHNNNKKRQRTDEDTTKCHTKSRKYFVERFDDILKNQKKDVISKHELFILPFRG